MDYKLYLHFKRLDNLEDMKSQLEEYQIRNAVYENGIFEACLVIHDEHFKDFTHDLACITDDDIVIFGADCDFIANKRAYDILRF